MKFKTLALILAQAIAVSSLAANDNCSFDHSLTIDDTKELHFDPLAESQEILVDNFKGSISVEGYDGDTVLLEVTRTIKARSESRIDVALAEVSLEIKENGDGITLYVDGPFRCGEGNFNYKGCHYYGYKNQFDFKLRIPHASNIFLRTIGGDMVVENTSGKFDVHNVNGSVSLRSISGSGSAYALNEDLVVSFKDNPEEDSFFGSLNGDVDISFQPKFDANLSLKTFNGKAYTDFKTTYSESNMPVSKHTDDNGLTKYNTDEFATVRVGNGGPRLKFDAFNGDILIKNINQISRN